MPANAPYRILSLDGGGSWALLQVMALKALYGDVPGHEVLARFDLVAGTSGGSIVLAGLAEGLKLSEIEVLVLSPDRRRRIFVKLPWWKKYLHPLALLRFWGIGPRYATAAKLKGLRELLPRRADVRLVDLPRQVGLPTHYMIVGHDYDTARSVFFRSNPASAAASFAPRPTPTLAEAVHASTDAPINYFDRAAEFSGGRYWDGATGGHNNPVLAAVIEALANGAAPSNVTALSIGTGTVRLPAATDKVKPPLATERIAQTLLRDVRAMALSVLDDPPDAATFIAHVALGQPLPAPGQVVSAGSVVRMNPVGRPVKQGDTWTLPEGMTLSQFSSLAELELDAVEDAEVELIRKLGDGWLAGRIPNQAIRAGADFHCEIGQATFAEARQAWQQIDRPG